MENITNTMELSIPNPKQSSFFLYHFDLKSFCLADKHISVVSMQIAILIIIIIIISYSGV